LENPNAIVVASGVAFGTDKFGHPNVHFPNDWTREYFIEKNPELKLHEMPIEQSTA
jgi:peptide chain release factor 3